MKEFFKSETFLSQQFKWVKKTKLLFKGNKINGIYIFHTNTIKKFTILIKYL